MTFMQQEQTYLIDVTPKTRRSYEYQPKNSNTTKRFLTNSDKSIFNLKWENRHVAEQNYQRNKSQSQQDLSKEKNSPRNDSHTYHHQKQPGLNYKPMHIGNSNTAHQAQPVPILNYYPYAHPPMPIKKKSIPQKPVKQQDTNRTTPTTETRPRIKQSDKSINLVRDTNKLKIEHHYVDSPEEAQRLIDKLQRRGFVETGIHQPTMYSIDNRN
ncbi:unnamed protein product [Rotaria sp. Silwood2]|nr:unnamed protein product [Rotaria sp. Silwood2]